MRMRNLAVAASAMAVMIGGATAAGTGGLGSAWADPSDTAVPTTTAPATTAPPTGTTSSVPTTGVTTPGTTGATTPNVPGIDIPAGPFTPPSVADQTFASAPPTARRGKDGTLRLLKIDAADKEKKPLPGAVFEVRKLESSASIAPLTGVATASTSSGSSSDSSSKVVVQRFETTARQNSIILPEGEYELAEVKAPKGFAVVDPVRVSIVAERVTAVTVADGKAPVLNVNKLDAASGAFLPGAKLEIRQGSSSSGSTLTATSSASATAAAGGQATVIDAPTSGATVGSSDGVLQTWVSKAETTSLILNPGTYTIREVTPPPGYSGLAAPVTVTVKAGDVKTLNITNSKSQAGPAGTPARRVIGSIPSGRTGESWPVSFCVAEPATRTDGR